ncbi:tail fiber domain-containing protein [Psychroserpens sp. MEBiC05023]
MRKLYTLLAFLVAYTSTAQQGINYKALIKDDLGNALANQSITVQFSILQGVAETNVYTEVHTPTTDANGLIILTIGEGIPQNGNYTFIDWALDSHALNVQLDTGSGFVDMGTTTFKAVPYALQAEKANNVEGLEKLNIGWRLIGKDPNNYGSVGLNAVDLSTNTSTSTTAGATGAYAVATGFNTTASGLYCTASGSNSTASGSNATAIGFSSTASGDNAFALGSYAQANGEYAMGLGYYGQGLGDQTIALGNGAISRSYRETTLGCYNTEYVPSDTENWVATDRLFGIGNGTQFSDTSDALIILKNGTITAPSFDVSEITDDKALITKEYADANTFSGDYNDLTNAPNIIAPSGLEALDEGNGIGWRLKGSNPDNYGNIGLNAKDLSVNVVSSTTHGATGDYSMAMGIASTASGDYSTAMGYYTTASNEYSTAMGWFTNALGTYSTTLGASTSAHGNFSTTIGYQVAAKSYNEIVIGNNSTDYSANSETSWNEDDRLFVIGNGGVPAFKSDALIILKNGTITAPSFDVSEITDDKALITKEYADANLGSSGLEAIDEGNGIGWRLKGRNLSSFGDIGFDSIDLSNNYGVSTIYGATGSNSITMGLATTASGDASTAMGRVTTASGNNSTSMGTSTIAPSFSETSIGLYNTDYTPVSNSSWQPSDRLFVVGNGEINYRSNAFTILKNGNTGIGTDTPNALMDIEGNGSSTSPHLEITEENANSGSRINFKNALESTNRWTLFARADNTDIDSQFNIFYSGLTQNVMSLRGDGNVYINGSLAHSSDRRLKKDIKDLPYGLNEVLQLEPKAYFWKDKPEQKQASLGLIAQDVEKVIANIVHTNNDDDKTLSLSYSELIPVLINAIKEQQKIIVQQNAKITALESFDSRIKHLEALLKTSEQ